MNTLKSAFLAGLVGYAGFCGTAGAAATQETPDILGNVHHYTVLSDQTMEGIAGQMKEKGNWFPRKKWLQMVTVVPIQALTGISHSPLKYKYDKDSVYIFHYIRARPIRK